MKLPPGFVEGNGHVRQHYSGYGKRLMQKVTAGPGSPAHASSCRRPNPPAWFRRWAGPTGRASERTRTG